MGVLGDDLVLQDLEIRLDVIQESLDIPLTFEFTRGFVKVCWLFMEPITNA